MSIKEIKRCEILKIAEEKQITQRAALAGETWPEITAADHGAADLHAHIAVECSRG